MDRLYWRRDDAQLLHRPRQVADDEAASGTPELFAFRQRANVALAFGHDAAGGGRNINAHPTPEFSSEHGKENFFIALFASAFSFSVI